MKRYLFKGLIMLLAMTGLAFGQSLPMQLNTTMPRHSFQVFAPSDTCDAVITMRVFDADFSNEGQMTFGAYTVGLYPQVATKPYSNTGEESSQANSNAISTVSIRIPSQYVNAGYNPVTIRHLRSAGSSILSFAVSYDCSTYQPSLPTPDTLKLLPYAQVDSMISWLQAALSTNQGDTIVQSVIAYDTTLVDTNVFNFIIQDTTVFDTTRINDTIRTPVFVTITVNDTQRVTITEYDTTTVTITDTTIRDTFIYNVILRDTLRDTVYVNDTLAGPDPDPTPDPNAITYMQVGSFGEPLSNDPTDRWLTTDAGGLFRNTNLVASDGGGSPAYEYDWEPKQSDPSRTYMQDSIIVRSVTGQNGGLTVDPYVGDYLRTRINLDKITADVYPYRAQVQMQYNRYTRGSLEWQAENPSTEKFDPWYTGIGQTLTYRFSMRVPLENGADLQNWPSSGIANGRDEITQMQVFQMRTRYNTTATDFGPDYNIPFDLYLRGDEWVADVLLSNSTYNSPNSPNQAWEAIYLGDVVPGQWVDFLVIQDIDTNAAVGGIDFYMRRQGETNFTQVFESRGVFGGATNPSFSNIIPEVLNGGSPSFGFYGSTRLTHYNVTKPDGWLERGIQNIQIDHSNIEMLQYNRGDYTNQQILQDAVQYWRN